MTAMALVLFILFIGVFVVVGIGGTILWIMAIIDCATHEPSADNNKVVWLLIIIFSHFIGAAIYFLVRRPQRIRELGH